MIFYEVRNCQFGGESYFFTRKADAESYVEYEYNHLGGDPELIIHDVKASRAEITKLINIGINAACGHPCNYELYDGTNFERGSK